MSFCFLSHKRYHVIFYICAAIPKFYIMFKRFFIFLVLFSASVAAFGQSASYLTKENLPYYDEATRKQDAYIAERCVLDVYYPSNTKGFATIVWFHGGGLTGGSKHTPQELKDKGFCVVAVNYRLHPKVTCPKYIEDAAAAVAWVFANIGKYGGDPGLVFVAGHSAGAYLSSMVGLDKRWLKPYGIDPDRIAALLPLSGNAITHMTIRKERGMPDTQPYVDEFAPLYHVRPDAPPLILMTGDRELEMLGRYEENAYLLRMMKIVKHSKTILHEFDGYGHDMLAPAFPLVVKYVNERVKELKMKN
jgi:acetyl esterase/lipase